jgi:hypothetical protein
VKAKVNDSATLAAEDAKSAGETVPTSGAPELEPGWGTPAPRSSRGLVLLGAAVVALGFSLLLTGHTMFSMLDHGHSWWRIFGWQLASWAFWVPLAPWIVELGMIELGGAPLWGERGVRRRIVRLLALSALLAGGQLVVSSAAATVLQPYLPVGRTRFLSVFESGFLTWVAGDLMVFWCLIAVGSAIAANRRSRAHELRESRLEAELARAQLDALRLEIQPHFLFNTLNSVAALIRRRSNDRALEVVLGLSELLRATVDRSDRHLVPLREEVEFVERYVALQKTRFADRLRVAFDVAADVAELPVPWLVLQPLVENAIRHGVAPRAGGGSIEVRARLEQGALVLEVADDGPGPGAEESAAGIGLRNVRSRLQQLYGDAASLSLVRTLESTAANGEAASVERTVATVRLPVVAGRPLSVAPVARAG